VAKEEGNRAVRGDSMGMLLCKRRRSLGKKKANKQGPPGTWEGGLVGPDSEGGENSWQRERKDFFDGRKGTGGKKRVGTGNRKDAHFDGGLTPHPREKIGEQEGKTLIRPEERGGGGGEVDASDAFSRSDRKAICV